MELRRTLWRYLCRGDSPAAPQALYRTGGPAPLLVASQCGFRVPYRVGTRFPRSSVQWLPADIRLGFGDRHSMGAELVQDFKVAIRPRNRDHVRIRDSEPDARLPERPRPL